MQTKNGWEFKAFPIAAMPGESPWGHIKAQHIMTGASFDCWSISADEMRKFANELSAVADLMDGAQADDQRVRDALF